MYLCICEVSFGACEALWRGLNFNPVSANLFYKTVCAVLSSSVVLDSCNPIDYSLPGSSVHGILQARILEWVVMPYSRGSPQPRHRTCISYVSCTDRQVLYHWHHLGSRVYIANSDSFTPSFPVCIPFIWFCFPLLWLGLLKLCWIIVVRVDILVLFLILEGKLSAFHHRVLHYLIAQLVKNPLAMRETWVRFLSWEELLEKGKATHSSILGLPWWLSW